MTKLQKKVVSESDEIALNYPDLRNHPFYYDMHYQFPDEKWKLIEGSDVHWISSWGRLKSFARRHKPKILKPYMDLEQPWLFQIIDMGL